MPFFRFLFVLGFWMAGLAAAAQPAIPIGQWRSHLSYTSARSVVQAGPRIYCGTFGGLFYYDTADNSLHPLSKVEGSSDVGVEKVAHDTETGITVVAYTNTNIDLILPDGRIHNLSDILRKQIIGNKTIRGLYTANKLAYVCTSFGVVVIDLERLEVKNTYSNLGPNGRVLDVYSVTTLNDSIYLAVRDAALSTGQKFRIMRARLSSTNLLDYNNWSTFTADPLLNSNPEPIWNLAAFNNKVYASANYRGIFYFNGTEWKQTSVDQNINSQDIFSLKVSNGALLASTKQYETPSVVEIHNPTSHTIYNNPEFVIPTDAIKTSASEFWVADLGKGLLRLQNFQTDVLTPNGPYSAIAFDMWSADNKVYVAGGAYNKSDAYVQTGSRAGFYEFAEGEWKNYNPNQITDTNLYPPIRDIVDVAQTPDGNLYLATYGHGVVKWKGPGNYTIYNDLNSPLVNIDPTPGEPYTRISGLDVDNQGTLWVVNRNQKNFGAAPSLFSLKPDGTWQGYSVPYAWSGFLEKLAVDDLGQKWIIVSYNVAGGILVFNEKTNRWRYLDQTSTGGRLPSKTVNSITKDLNGAMWVGTENGVGVYYSPSQILQPTYNVEPRPLIDGRYLLENQVVNDIVVDGGNRKWIASEQGLWLVNETGTEVLAHFTAENSPLPQNKVNKLVMNQETGELFIATDAGLVSYRGAATITETNDACTGVFPNPVRPGFAGTVGISGVPGNALVKITDLSGALVYEVKANGNTASWNLRDYNGKRVQPGIYLILSSSNDGTQTFSCKIAVLE